MAKLNVNAAMKNNAADDHFRHYLNRNSLEEKELKVTLAKLDEEKFESLCSMRRQMDSFTERHSHRIFSLQFDRIHSRTRWTTKGALLTRTKSFSDKKTDISNAKDKTGSTSVSCVTLNSSSTIVRDKTSVNFCEIQKLKNTKLRIKDKRKNLVTTKSTAPYHFPPKLTRNSTDSNLKLPQMSVQTIDDTKASHKNKVTLNSDISKTIDTDTHEHEEGTLKTPAVKISTEVLNPRRRRKLIREESNGSVQNMDIPNSKLEIFKQLSHRVRRMSTWCYLLRDVFDRLSYNEEYLGYRIHKENKTLEEMYKELQSCRYLRMPSVQRFTPSYNEISGKSDEGKEN